VLPVLENAGLSLLSDSLVTPSRIPSSCSTVTSCSSCVLGSTTLVRTGTISSLNLPEAWARAARWNDSAAKASCFSRETLYLAATFSPARGEEVAWSGCVTAVGRRVFGKARTGDAHGDEAVGGLLVGEDNFRHLRDGNIVSRVGHTGRERERARLPFPA
jgi:hypothetical protein